MTAEESAKAWEEDEWELCNDDGFVYKRRKTRKTEEDHTTTTTTTTTGGAVVDLEAEVRQRKRTQRKNTLLKLKDQYKREIVQWENVSNMVRDMEERTQIHNQHENVSNTVRDMEERTQIHNQLQRQLQLQPSSSSSVMKQPENMAESSCGTLIDDLLLQAEAQEAMIQDISDLCDAAEAIYKAEEACFKQSFIDLLIWASSPHSLLASLSDHDECNNNGDNVQIT